MNLEMCHGRMIVSIVKIVPLPDKRVEVLDILATVTGPTQSEPGCLDCSLLEEHGDEYAIFYVEQWRSEQEMNRHIRSSLYDRVLQAMDLSRTPPDVKYHEISHSSGLELVSVLRNIDPLEGRVVH